MLPARALRAGDSFLNSEFSNIKLIIGLGNPGPRFHNTRHNVGFAAIDALAERLNLQFKEQQDAQVAQWQINATSCVTLLKPQTFMNSSGLVLPRFQKSGLQPAQLLVMHDELERGLGTLSLRFAGSARGHNGLKSIISAIGVNFWRLQFGIGRPESRTLVADYVLHKFSPVEKVDVEGAIDTAVQFFVATI